jgi:MFS family permease
LPIPAIILQKVPVAKWLGANVVCWGVATACTVAAHNFGSLLAARIFLGIFEAAIAPSLMLISSQWYTKSEAAPRFSIWYAGLGVGQILCGVVSYAFQQVKNPSFSGWKIMFVVLGHVAVVVGFVTCFFLPDTPMNARFSSESEKIVLLKHVAVNQTGIVNKRVKLRQIVEVLLDIQLWLMVVLTILVGGSPYIKSLKLIHPYRSQYQVV